MKTWTPFLFLTTLFQWGTASSDTDRAKKEVCYGDLGCFSTEKPWSSPGRIARLPDHPEKINTTFLLHTRRDSYNDLLVKLVAGDVQGLLNSYFDGLKPTIFILHGFNDYFTHDTWLKQMATEFLQLQDANVFSVDWRNGARAMYGKAVANTRVVAAEIAKMIKFLNEHTGLTNDRIHLVGHSLGAHAAGYVGSQLKGIGRITGMDAAGPYFHDTDPLVRLDETDALFVDILHTDSSDSFAESIAHARVGIWQPIGHVDVYVSGGVRQPGCDEVGPIQAWKDEDIEMSVFRYIFVCAHTRAYEITMESILSKCPFQTYSCKDWDEFKTGRCLHCPSDGLNKTCNSVALKAIKPADASVNNRYYMSTGPKKPFCRYHYHVKLQLSAKSNYKEKGRLWFKLFGTRATLNFFAVNDDEKILLKPGSTYDFLVTSPDDLGDEIKAVEVKWEHDAAWYDISQWHLFSKPTIFLHQVTAFSGEHQTEAAFCDQNTEQPLNSKRSRNLSFRC